MAGKKKTLREKKTGRYGELKAGNEEIQNDIFSLHTYLGGEHRDRGICLVIFFAAMFLIISTSNPALFLNDEWITVNQVHQLDIGHQITINEGKYGVYQNGTPSAYFTYRNNILMYSLALPIASLPVLKIFGIFADHFRLAIITFWAFLPFLSALVISVCYPTGARIRSLRITVITAVIGFLLLAANLLVYSPFIWSAPDAPIEVAAVIFTNHILFALTMVMIYLIARMIFDNRWKAFFAMLAGSACSAYLFWSANAKDHMATAFAFSIILFWFIRYIHTRKLWDAAAGFFFIGILAWIRPELGFSVFFCCSLFVSFDNLFRIHRKEISIRSGVEHICTIFATAIGALPFFLNNIIVSGNPFTPSFLLEEKTKYSEELIQVVPVDHAINVSQYVTTNPIMVVIDLIGTIGQFFFSVTPNPIPDFYGILFFPASLSMGLFFVSPLALLALILIPLILIRKPSGKVYDHRECFLILLVMAFAVILAYLHCLSGLNSSHGIGPDIRYLSPLYIPVILLSLMLLERTILFAHPKALVIRSCMLGIFFVPLLFVAVILLNPSMDPYNWNYTTFFNKLILTEIFLTILVVTGYHSLRREPDTFSDFILPILILTILTWQILMIFLISPVAKFNGYPLWIPGIEVLSHQFIIVDAVP